jgi:hypothetical protein
MANSSTFPIGRTVDGGDAEDAIDELKNAIVGQKSFGTAAPATGTIGSIYYQLGATQSDPVKVFVKVNGVWYGG